MAPNIENISPETKKEIARLLWTRKKVRENSALDNWKPWEPEQLAAFRSQARTRLVMGGNRSGKTQLGAADVAHSFMGTHPFRKNRIPTIIKVVGTDFPNTIRNVILPKLMKMIPKNFITKIEKNQQGIPSKLIGLNDSVIDLMSYDQESTKFESFDADEAWFDEPPPEEIYKAVRRGLIDREGTMLFTMTPIREPWIYDTLWLPCLEGRLTDAEYFILPTEHNPYLKKAEIDSFKEVYTEEELDARLHGHFLHLSGLIYKSFRRDTHVVPMFDWPHEWPVWMCIDPHPRKDHAVSWVGVTNKDQKVILDELKVGCSINELASKILTKESQMKYRVVDRLIDTSIKGLDRDDQHKLLVDAGLRCRFPKKHDDVMPGIERVQQLLEPRKTHEGNKWFELVVRENCKGHVSEFMSYVWDDNGKPKKLKDDYMDNIRYISGAHPRFEYRPQTMQYVKGFYV